MRLALALVLVSTQTFAASPALPGRVIADPRASQQVTADQAGKLEAPSGGFPSPGERLRAGQIVAWLRPAIPAPERRDLDAQLATATRDVTLGELQVKRFNANATDAFDGQLALPSLQILGDYRSARERRAQLVGALEDRVALTAPRGGTVLASRARQARNVVGGQTVFELVDAGGLAVEVLSPLADVTSARRYDRAVPVDGDTPSALQLVAQSFDPELRVQRLLFAVQGDSRLQPGEPVRVVATHP
ncbi:MAG: hypothetical protein K0Q76_1451 [Panacagrimonas sp.]|jgi:hypothetical protein|nr:HlyD family efflux transporter periplasmic adaptor subunit [Panacagrimonas sp.]MCC2656343.1 hypothetical protein [Panacagrimonas sp.]